MSSGLPERFGFDYVYANELEIENGRLTGRFVGDVVDGKRKAELLKIIAQVEKIDIAQTIAVGDGANDLPMLSTAGLGIAFHAKPKVKLRSGVSICGATMITLYSREGLSTTTTIPITPPTNRLWTAPRRQHSCSAGIIIVCPQGFSPKSQWRTLASASAKLVSPVSSRYSIACVTKPFVNLGHYIIAAEADSAVSAEFASMMRQGLKLTADRGRGNAFGRTPGRRQARPQASAVLPLLPLRHLSWLNGRRPARICRNPAEA